MGAKWVIADIHGCYLTLKELVEKQLKPGNGDILYFLGDYIDRGPRSQEVISYIRTLEKEGLPLKALMGNHEEGMLNAYNEDMNPQKRLFRKTVNKSKLAWYEYGGKETMQSFGTDDVSALPGDMIEWVKGLPSYIEEEKFLLAHAGFNFRKADIFADEHSMRWIRDFEVDMDKTSGRRVIHGHVPVAFEVLEQLLRSQSFPYIDLDNGCVYPHRSGMGNLVALDLETMELKVQRNMDM